MKYLSICAIIKNEGKNLVEWIEYHKRIGIEHFYIYDNNSYDNTREILEAYKDVVTYKIWNYEAPCQLNAYMDCVALHKEETQWMSFIDCDEFIVSEKPLPDLMKEYEEYSGLGINWRIYGSSGHEKRPQGNIIDNFTYRASDDFEINKHIKTIANPRKIQSTWNPHSFSYTDGYCVTENKEPIDYPLTTKHSSHTIYLNHYYCKSKEDFIEKQKRARVDIAGAGYDFTDFLIHDQNTIYDPLGIDKNIKLVVLFLQYDQKKYPYAYVYLEKYLKMLKCKGTSIIISNQEKQLYTYGKNNINYIQGDNSSGEFSGWQKGIELLDDNKIDYDVILFANDALFNPGCYFDFDSVISDAAITQCKRLNTIVGTLCDAKPNTIIDGYEIKDFIRTNCFMISKKALDEIKTIVSITPEFIDKIINKDTSLPFWKENGILSKELKSFLIGVITEFRHTPIDINKNRPECIRKVHGYLNEYMLTKRIEGI